MPALSPQNIAAYFAAGDQSATAAGKGAALEDLLVHLFGQIPGVRLIKRDVITEDGGGEIDLIFWNDKTALDFLPNILMFECKNWAAPVDSASVAFFVTKAAQNRHLTHAFLIASSGITGNADQVRAAHAHLHNALVAHDCKIVVFDRGELCGLDHTDRLIDLIIEKISLIYLMGV